MDSDLYLVSGTNVRARMRTTAFYAEPGRLQLLQESEDLGIIPNISRGSTVGTFGVSCKAAAG